jgi:glucose-6-phosphate 1-dehydrogenase
MRFRISPDTTIALGATVMSPGETLKGEAMEMVASNQTLPEEMSAYERILGDAMAGNPTHFAREDYVEEAWRIVDPILKAVTPIYEYDKLTWGPSQVEQAVVPPGGWHNPITADQEKIRVAAKGA